MKTAVIVTGLMRVYNDTYKSLLESFPNSDIYINTWDIVGNIVSKDKSNTNSLTQELVKIHDIRHKYQPADLIVEPWQEWYNKYNDSYCKVYQKYKHLDSAVTEYMFVNSLFAQYYKVHNILNRISNVYDLIIRVRPDMLFHKPVEFSNLYKPADNEILVKHYVHHQAMDYFVAGSYHAMQIYANFYTNLIKTIEQSGYLRVEKLLKFYLEHSGLTLKIFQFDFSLLRPDTEKVFTDKKIIKQR